MKRIRKFNENSSEDFIEDIKQILMPLMDEGYHFKVLKMSTNLGSVMLPKNSKDEFYEFVLHTPRVYPNNGEVLIFTNENGPNHKYREGAAKSINSMTISNIETLSNRADKINNNIPEIVDRLEDTGCQYELFIDDDLYYVTLKIKKN